MKKIILVITLIIFNTVHLYSDSNIMTKKVFSQIILEKAPKGICSEQMYKECIKVSNSDCLKYMNIAVKLCYDAVDRHMPAEPTIIELDIYSNRIGHCAGAMYEIIMTKANKVDKQCLTKWTEKIKKTKSK